MATVPPNAAQIKFPAPLADGAFPARVVLAVLAYGLDILFGPAASAAMLACLCAVSGRTGTPLRVWLRGDIQLQRTVVRLIELLLGARRVLRITSLTDAGIVALGTGPMVELLVISADLRDPKLRALVEQLIIGSTISHLDAPGGESLRHRVVRRPYAILLMGDAAVESDEALAALLILKLESSQPTLQLHGRMVLSSFYPDAHQIVLGALQWALGLRESLERVVWRATVDCTDACDSPWTRSVSWGDSERLRQLHALVKILSLIDLADNAVPTVQATPTSLPLAVTLLDIVGTEDARGPLSPALIKLLLAIRNWAAKPPAEFDGAGLEEVRYTQGPAFSVYDIMTHNGELAALAPQTLHSQLLELEQRGHVAVVGFAGLRKLYRLTDRGWIFGRSSLARNLKRIVGAKTSAPANAPSLFRLLEEVTSPP